MRAHLPYTHDHSAKGKRKQAVATAMLLFARALYEAGEYPANINRWIVYLNEATCRVTDAIGNCFSNKTWQDEILYWGEQQGIELPDVYILHIPGELTAAGNEQKLLILLELFALTGLGYGRIRLRRVFDKYAEISGLYTGGRALYSKRELYAWADEKGICYK